MPKIYISTNQIKQDEVNKCERLACDGIHFIGENSPDVWDWSPLEKMNDSVFITEEGATDRNWLFQAPGYPPPRRIDFNKNIAVAAGYHVDSSLTYVEHPRTLLEPADVALAREILGRKVMLLARSFTDWDETKQRVRAKLQDENVRGIIFEFVPGAGNVRQLAIDKGIAAVLEADKRCGLLMPPADGTYRYEYRVKETIKDLQGLKEFKSTRLSLILACYRRETTTVNFLGKHNSIEAALKWIKKNVI